MEIILLMSWNKMNVDSKLEEEIPRRDSLHLDDSEAHSNTGSET